MGESIYEIIKTIILLVSLGGWSFIVFWLGYISGNTKGFSDGYDEPRKIIDELENLRAELHKTAEMHIDGDYYLRDEWVDEYIDNYIVKLKGEGNENF